MKTSSDGERAELRGPVRTVADDWSTTVFDRDGKILEWRGYTSHGPSERTYSYNGTGKLIRITGSSGDHIDELRYDEEGRMTRIRHVPSPAEQKSHMFGIAAWFEAISEGDTLTEGGTVVTTYNAHDQPIDCRLFDEEGLVLFRIVYSYDEAGRLSREKLTMETLLYRRPFVTRFPSSTAQPHSIK